jgi:hypothetical protein
MGGFSKSMRETREMRITKAKRDTSMCYKKSRYPTEQRARLYADKAEADRGVKLRVYSCPICMGWHMTKQMLNHDPNTAPVEIQTGQDP